GGERDSSRPQYGFSTALPPATSRRLSSFILHPSSLVRLRLISLILILAAAFVPPALAQSGRPPTGIPALDSLPLHDWGVPDRPLSMPLAIGLATVFPGGGQFYGGHPVRGSFLVGLEALLAGIAIYTYKVDL